MSAAVGLALAAAASFAGAVDLAPCELDTAGMERVHARCGSVRSDDGVNVGFAILEATGRTKKPDPLVLLPGGPGQAWTELAGFAQIEFGAARRDRDVVLFDPRGAGRSSKLSCEDKRPLAERLNAGDEEDAARLTACAKKLVDDATAGRGLDPRSITTARIAKDLDEVRAALGVTTWNLAGVSYGTRLALAYDRAFPGHARALVLDSVVPFSMIVGDNAAADAEAALTAVDARCAKTPGCARNVDDPSGPGDHGTRSLVEIVRNLAGSLATTPQNVAIAHPTTGKRVSVRVDGRAVAAVVRLLLYADQTAALLPPILRAADRGDLTLLAAQLYLADKEGETMSEPLQLSVLCAEDVPYLADEAAPGASAPFSGFAAQMKKACAAWPHADVPKSFHDDLPASSTPALFIGGSADPITPPRFFAAAKKTLPQAHQLVGVGLGHNAGIHGCIPDEIARFLDDPAAPGLAACGNTLSPFPVFIDSMGPAP